MQGAVRRNSESIATSCNAADGPLRAGPKGAPQEAPCGVASLDNSSTIGCGRRLAWRSLERSEPIIIPVSRY